MKDLIYGVHAVKEAILAGKALDKILVQKDDSKTLNGIKQLGRQYNIPVQAVPALVIDKLCYQKNHQGVAAYVSSVEYQPIEEIVIRAFERGEYPLLVMLDGVTDVRNLGAIARSAEGMGVHALIVPQSGSARINQDALKTSCGAFYHLPVSRQENLKKTVLLLKSMGVTVLACTEKATQKVYELPLNQPVCWVLGDENKGISNSLLKLCDGGAAIPMLGKIQSFNVSVACGIVLYETQKQRNTYEKSIS